MIATPFKAMSAQWILRLRAADRGARKAHAVILGAGPAGLCAAYELEKRGHTVTILEAEREHIGGRARTLRFGMDCMVKRARCGYRRSRRSRGRT